MKLFISYSSSNRWQVNEVLVKTMREGGYEPWIDFRLIPGKPWKIQLEQAVTSCDALVYAMTPASIESEWCQWEVNLAAKLQKPIIPVLLEKKVNVPDWIQQIHFVDFSDGPTGLAVAKLLQGIMHAQPIDLSSTSTFSVSNDPKGEPSSA